MEFDFRRHPRVPHVRRVRHAAAVMMFALAALPFGSGVRAQDATLLTAPPAADCTTVGSGDVSRVLGYTVGDPDEASRSGGICAFSTRAATEEGTVTYAIVTAQRLPQRRAFFIGQARRCGSVSPDAPRALACQNFVALASAQNLDAYFAARTATSDAAKVPDLGDAAFLTADALYVRRAAAVFEIIVRRGDMLDVPRSIDLAKLLLGRSPGP